MRKGREREREREKEKEEWGCSLVTNIKYNEMQFWFFPSLSLSLGRFYLNSPPSHRPHFLFLFILLDPLSLSITHTV